MKEYYKISEISALYNICNDSLRYYEDKGILSPKRDNNGYRLYGVQDFWKLNVIKDLRQLNFSTERIKAYLDDRTVQSTLALLQEEEALITKQMDQLAKMQINIQQRAADIVAMKRQPVGQIALKQLADRPCCRIKEHVSLDGEVDFLIKRLQKEHENNLYIIGNNRIGALLDAQYWRKGVYNQYSAVFIIDDKDQGFGNAIIPSGQYLTVIYRGEYQQTAEYLPKLLDYAAVHGYQICGEPLEIYHIDIHETSRREEFLTEVQLPVEIREEESK